MSMGKADSRIDVHTRCWLVQTLGNTLFRAFFPCHIVSHCLIINVTSHLIKSFTLVLVMNTNLMHYLSYVYFVNQPVHVSGIFIAHHQEVYFIYTTGTEILQTN